MPRIKRVNGRFPLVCKQCGKTFLVCNYQLDPRRNVRFCSLACGNKSRRIGQTEQTCQRCGKTFKVFNCYLRRKGGKFCSRHCWRMATVEAKQVIKLKGICERCGWKKEPAILQIHHKDRNRKHNQADNLELLCPNCHETLHYQERSGPYFKLGRRTKRLETTMKLFKEAKKIESRSRK